MEGVCAQWGGAKSRRLEISAYNVNSADLRKDMRGLQGSFGHGFKQPNSYSNAFLENAF